MRKIRLVIVGTLLGVFWVVSSFGLTDDGSTYRRIDPPDTTVHPVVKKKSPWGAVFRSAIFPGWGQWYNGKWLKAIVVFGAEVGLVANSLYLHRQFKNSRTQEQREYYRDNRNLSNWWLAGTFLFSLLDAYVDAHLSDFDDSSNLSLHSVFEPDGGMYVGFSVLFRFNNPE